jgi:membrane-associated phospholipid phosphatase
MTPTAVRAQTAVAPCSFSSATHDLGHDAKSLARGIVHAPRNALRKENLAWELPIGAATGIMIAKVDRPAADRIQSKSLQDVSGTWSNVGLGMELGAGALGWSAGCLKRRSALAEAGFTALTAMGAAGTVDLGLKLAFDRQYPFGRNSTGKFWGGGRSFPSGHSATSFAFASTVAHRYPHNRWIKWGAYALASGVSLSRYPAKKHFPSDILVGATLGYVTGAYIADHASDATKP